MKLIEQRKQLGWPYAIYFAIAIVALLFTSILLPKSAEYFQRFFGQVHPLLTVISAALLGGASLWGLSTLYGFDIHISGSTRRGVLFSFAFSTGLGVAIAIADSIIRYPENMNVPLPQALLFYPAVGFVAEIVFHVLPLTLILLALRPFVNHLGSDRIVWLGILLVAVFEPTFQVMFEPRPLTWGAAYTWTHVFAIAALQLYVFRKFGFLQMYLFRLFYYLYWHILWGTIRLEVLF